MNIFNNFVDSAESKFSRLKLPIIIFFIIGVCFYYLLCVSWLRWGNLLIDTSRELWISSQILEGRVLYKDLFYPSGIFAPYFLAFLYKIFGININTLIGCGIVITIIVSILIYKISRLFLDEFISCLAVITFLFVLSFGYYRIYSGIFNWILPYSFSATLFIFFISLALYFFLKFILFEKERYIFLWSIFLSLAFFCRIEIAFSVWIGFILSGVLLNLKNKNIRSAKLFFYLFLPLIISILGYFLFMFKFGAFTGFKESIVGAVKTEISSGLFFKRGGFENYRINILFIFASFFIHLIIIIFIGICSFIISYFSSKNEYSPFHIIGILVLFIAFVISQRYLGGVLQYKCLPLILLIGTTLFFFKTLSPGNYKGNLSFLTLFLISLFLISKISLSTSPDGYGFYLLSFGIICYYIFFFKIVLDYLPLNLRKHLKLFSAILIVFFIFIIKSIWMISFESYALRNLEIITNRGKVFCLPDDISKRFWEAVDYLKRNSSNNDTVVVFPEGVSMNFFAQRRNPSRYYHFLPLDMVGIGEERIISELSKCDIDYTVIVQRPTFEFGYPFFGIHYAQKLYSWIQNNYDIVKQFGPYPFTSKGFGILILKRKN